LTLKIDIQTIPHRFQRYDTIGDWTGNERHRMIFISEMGNNDYEFLIAFHELVEQALCLKRGITDEEVTTFDKEYTKDLEPGASPDAPYYKEHQFATKIEKMMCKELGISWGKYNTNLDEFLEKTTYD
jgi:hypothetical protein